MGNACCILTHRSTVGPIVIVTDENVHTIPVYVKGCSIPCFIYKNIDIRTVDSDIMLESELYDILQRAGDNKSDLMIIQRIMPYFKRHNGDSEVTISKYMNRRPLFQV
jgi:hypothetical protein